jgi:hypothetical protein
MLANYARHCGGLVVLSLFVFTLGCGSSAKPRAVVKGKVLIGDKHLTAGNVMFYGNDNATASATIDKTGNYVMGDAPIGEVKVTVTVPKISPAMLAKMNAVRKGIPDAKSVDPSDPTKAISIMGDMPEKIVPIPDKYAAPETSGLTYTVQNGEQTKDFVLTP